MPYATGVLYRDGAPMVFDSGDYPAVLERCLEAVGYDAFRERQAAARAGGRHLGIGLACNVESTGIGPFETARVTVDRSGRVAVATGVADTGQGHATVFAQVCADHLGVDLADVFVAQGDSAAVPFGLGTYHSRAAVTAGSAVAKAAGLARAKVLAVAAHLFEVAPEDLVLARGVVSVRGSPGRSLTLADCARACVPGEGLPPGLAPGIDETAYFDAPAVTWANACHAAIVAVDPRTGMVDVDRYVVVHDCGRMLNPLIVDGQIRGGVVAGIGGALLEHFIYDEDAQPQTTTLMDYLLPALSDVPPIEIFHIETPSPLNPLGVKGAGEGGTLGPPAAIAAAVEDALAAQGVRLSRTPLSPHTILAALEEAAP
jgi:carbon-monoxide dehydrogenase large subunit